MLIKFAVKNFRGFPDRIEWDLCSPSSYEFNTYAIKDGTIKNGIIYGPNGAGKTNFSLAIFDIVNHLSQKWKLPNYYNNFIYAGHADSTVDFEYTFRFGKQTLQYNYSKNSNGVLVSESLCVDDNIIFQRDAQCFRIEGSQFPMDSNTKYNLENNANNVSIVNFILISFPLNHDHYLIKLQQFVGSMLWFRNLDVREFIGLETGVTILDNYIISHDLLDDFANFLYNISGQHFQFEVSGPIDKQIVCRIGDKTIPFSRIASTGTQSLHLLYFWIQRMKDASFVFIDEFDAFYHYKLSFEICKLLFNMDCQIFTSTHNTYLMTNELLRPDCYFILDKNRIRPLTKCTERELREAHNIEKIYKAGAFDVE